jgi:hypothetical protein
MVSVLNLSYLFLIKNANKPDPTRPTKSMIIPMLCLSGGISCLAVIFPATEELAFNKIKILSSGFIVKLY